ncbi:hypothetical protein ASD11_16400 [Aeromicrobium sp. Root495]|uniref:hypothetical protein n=1 Tax=Aeromicrobium sp. Root495 TaxID=1736550 RepID=UPI0006FC8417|nr:hypothetical protein [Aeromicrobium sp. Root495]KQY56050.1 hypothetical protein ASD11_16400 [Aeromicrobium sp. Root495]
MTSCAVASRALGRLLVGAAAVLVLTACQSDDGSEPAEPSPASTLATSVASLDSYCQVQQLRQMIDDGELERSELPSFADRTEVEGTPRIVDFTKQPSDSSAALVGRLLSSPGLKSVELDPAEVESCMESTTDADVERSQGGPGYLADR